MDSEIRDKLIEIKNYVCRNEFDNEESDIIVFFDRIVWRSKFCEVLNYILENDIEIDDNIYDLIDDFLSTDINYDNMLRFLDECGYELLVYYDIDLSQYSNDYILTFEEIIKDAEYRILYNDLALLYKYFNS